MSKPKVWGKAFGKNLTKLLESQKDLMPDYLQKRWQITEGGTRKKYVIMPNHDCTAPLEWKK